MNTQNGWRYIVESTPRPINTMMTLNPSAIRATREAFEAAARALGCTCGGRPATLPLEVQVRLARRIVEYAAAGERNVDALRDFALASVVAHQPATSPSDRQLGHQHVGGRVVEQGGGDAAPDRANDAGSAMCADHDQIGRDAVALRGYHFRRRPFLQHARQ